MAGIIRIVVSRELPQEVSIAQVFHPPIYLFQKYVLVATECGYLLSMKNVPTGIPSLNRYLRTAGAGFLEPHPPTPNPQHRRIPVLQEEKQAQVKGSDLHLPGK